MKDYLHLASECTQNAKLSFSAAAYSDINSALAALKAGDIDCVFPVSLSAYDSEELGISVTTPFIDTEMYAAVRKNSRHEINSENEMTAAVMKDSLNYEVFLKENFRFTVLYNHKRSDVKALVTLKNPL